MKHVGDLVLRSRDSGPVPASGSHPDARSASLAPSSLTEIPPSAASVSGPLASDDLAQLLCDVSLLLQKIEREHADLRRLQRVFRYFGDENGDDQIALVGAATLTDIAAAVVRGELLKRGIEA